jgi:hypothetical protein
MNPFTRFVQQMLRQRAQHPDPAISVEARRVIAALEQGKRATMRPMPVPPEAEVADEAPKGNKR